MQYLVQLRLSNSDRSMTPAEGVAFVEELIFPTLKHCETLEREKKSLAGGPMSGAVALAFIVTVETAQELDDLVTSLPVWPRMETEVIPLTTFDGRRRSLLSRVEELKAQERESGKSKPGADR